MIRSGAEVPDGFTLRTQVCVIGSGAGGGVAAAMFAEAGKEVVVLEEGQQIPTARLNQREEQMYPLLYRDGGNQQTRDGFITVLQGRTLGGSTVINMSDVTPISEAVLGHWATRYGWNRYSKERFEEAFAACRTTIEANRIPDDLVNRNGRILLDGGRTLGIRGGVFDHNRVGCRGSGYCMVGCAYDAKRTVAHTWIPRALATGRVMVQTDARASKLRISGGKVVAVEGELLDPERHSPGSRFTIEADHVVLAAGSIHSPLLLLASGLGGQVGKNLSLQPQAPCAAVFEDEVVHFRGIPQAAFLDGLETATTEQGMGGFRLESIAATPGMSAASMVGWGPSLRRDMGTYRHMAALLCLVPDQPSGEVRAAKNGRPEIRYTASPAWIASLRQGLRTAAEVYLAAGATHVALPLVGAPPITDKKQLDSLDSYPIGPGWIPLLSAHPQGTCRAGPDERRSVVGLDLRVHGVSNLQVLDASVFPTTSSSHTMLPVMALAWLGAQEIV